MTIDRDPHPPLPTPLAVSLADTVVTSDAEAIAPKDDGGWVSVLCLRCGEESPVRVPPNVDVDTVSYFCPTCHDEMAREPVVLDGYHVLRRLGRGAMGVVDLVRHDTHGLRVLKRMLPRVALSERNRRMFVREATEQGRARHPNIVELFSFHEQPAGVFVAVLEYVEGANADELRERQPSKRMPTKMAIHVIEQALQGLAFMHDKGIVHRDIKEENLMVQLDPTGRIVGVKITDFGLAKNYTDLTSSGLTATGEIAGTMPYMPPEQISDYRTVRPPADIYAMGASLYRMLSGSYPHAFGGRHPLAVILSESPIPLRDRVPSVPASLSQCLETAMARDPERRFASANAMREALLAIDLVGAP